jgi:hypothetical protein
LFLEDIHTGIFAEGFRDKIFDTEVVAVLGRALSDENNSLRQSTIRFFTVAMAQGALCCFHGILIPQYSQRAFGTRCLTLRSSPHLDVY